MPGETMLKVWVVGCEPKRLQWLHHHITSRWPAALVSGVPERPEGAPYGVPHGVPYGVPDAVLLLIDFAADVPAGEALDAMVRLLRAHPRLHCIVLAENGSELTAVRALQAGARQYLPVARITGNALLKALAEPGARAWPAATTPSGDNPPAPRDAAPVIQVPGYTLLDEISTSQFAAVFLAESESLGCKVVLKVMRRSGSGREPGAARFQHEYESMSSISHRAIAQIHAVGSLPAHRYLALEYIPGGNLRDRLRHPMSIDESLYYLRTIAEALRVIHELGILHRDLKPANVMLREDDSPVLIDFGLARSSAEDGGSTEAGHVIGSPYYMSPEQSQGFPLDARTDLYSLGVMFHEMLTGRRPFDGRSAIALMAQHAGAPVPRLPAQMSRQQAVLDRLLAKNVADRYAAADELLADLVGSTPTWGEIDSNEYRRITGDPHHHKRASAAVAEGGSFVPWRL